MARRDHVDSWHPFFTTRSMSPDSCFKYLNICLLNQKTYKLRSHSQSRGKFHRGDEHFLKYTMVSCNGRLPVVSKHFQAWYFIQMASYIAILFITFSSQDQLVREINYSSNGAWESQNVSKDAFVPLQLEVQPFCRIPCWNECDELCWSKNLVINGRKNTGINTAAPHSGVYSTQFRRRMEPIKAEKTDAKKAILLAGCTVFMQGSYDLRYGSTPVTLNACAGLFLLFLGFSPLFFLLFLW